MTAPHKTGDCESRSYARSNRKCRNEFCPCFCTYRTDDRVRGEIEDRSAEAVVAVDAPLERHKLLDVTKHGRAMLYAEIADCLCSSSQEFDPAP